jgi:hypothetical protein
MTQKRGFSISVENDQIHPKPNHFSRNEIFLLRTGRGLSARTNQMKRYRYSPQPEKIIYDEKLQTDTVIHKSDWHNRHEF